MSPQQREFRTEGAPNRSRFHRSVLDKMSEDVTRELARRCASSETLVEICAWLKNKHSIKIGRSAVSEWWSKRIVARRQTETKTVHAGGFEVTVTAPGATSITVRFVQDAREEGGK